MITDYFYNPGCSLTKETIQGAAQYYVIVWVNMKAGETWSGDSNVVKVNNKGEKYREFTLHLESDPTRTENWILNERLMTTDNTEDCTYIELRVHRNGTLLGASVSRFADAQEPHF